MSGMLLGWWELVLPATCAGCRREIPGLLCTGCAAELAGHRPRPVRPQPAPPGLPPCHAVGRYGGVLRELIVAYKDRGRHGLATLLGGRLAAVVSAAAPDRRPVVLVPVPTTAKAIRRRRGDHMLRLALAAARTLRRSDRVVRVVRPVRARPRPDSAGLSAAERLRLARDSLLPRRMPRVGAVWAGGAAASEPPVVVVADDVITTGATLAATCQVLAGLGLRVDAGALLAATERRTQPTRDAPW